MAKVVRHQYVLILSILLISGNTWTQSLLDKKITIDVSQKPIPWALNMVAKEGGFSFAYNSSFFSDSELVSLHTRSESVSKILRQILGKSYQYKVRGSYVIIQKAEPEFPSKRLYAMKGSIVNANGQKVSDVTVYETNSLTSSLTNNDGSYALSVKSKSDHINLAISSKEYRDTVIQVSKTDGKPFEVVLIPRLNELKPMHSLDSSGLVKFFGGEDHNLHINNVYLEESRLFQVSFLPKFGTNGRMSGLIDNTFSLNIIAGYSNGVKALEVGGVLNIVRNKMNGFQIAGVGNLVGGKVNGLQLSGVYNINNQTVRGAQIGGVINISRDSLAGAQIAGVTNVSGKSFSGFQIAGVNNHSKEGRGAQIAGVINLTQSMKGLQIGGVSNHTKKMSGLQIAGVVNTNSDTLKGVQIAGVINKTKTLKGVQIGVINISDTIHSGFALGLFNFVKNGYRKLEIESNDVTQANLTYKMGHKKFYNTYSAGYRFDSTPLLAFGLGFGTHIDLPGKLFSNLEINNSQLQPLSFKSAEFSLLSKFKCGVGYSFGKHFSLYTGLTYNLYVSDQLNPDTGVHGYDIGNNSFYNKTTSRETVKMWLGYSVALQF